MNKVIISPFLSECSSTLTSSTGTVIKKTLSAKTVSVFNDNDKVSSFVFPELKIKSILSSKALCLLAKRREWKSDDTLSLTTASIRERKKKVVSFSSEGLVEIIEVESFKRLNRNKKLKGEEKDNDLANQCCLIQ